MLFSLYANQGFGQKTNEVLDVIVEKIFGLSALFIRSTYMNI